MSIYVTFKGQVQKICISSGTILQELISTHYPNKNIIACAIDGIMADINTEINENQKIELYDFDSKEGQHVYWHSSAHILGNALVNLYQCKLVNGPALDEGFYYDIDIERPIREEDFADIEKEMQRIINKNINFRKKMIKKDDLLKMYKDNDYKVHFINNIPDNLISVYYNDEFYDMCQGPHIQSTGLVKAFKILKSSSCYFLNSADNQILQRIYGISFPNRTLLKEYEEKVQKAKEMDHRKIGKELNLYFFHEYSPGSCFWLPDGVVIYNRLMEFLRKEYIKRGFKEVITPNIFHIDLWKESGHYQNYKENIYGISGEDFALKPMNCPGHCIIFKSVERSYKELPLRYADFGVLHRNECSGSLTGLTRVRRFQQDDAHIFTSKSSIKEEIENAIGFLKTVYSIFNFKYELFLSTRPTKFLGTIEEWDVAEKSLKDAIIDSGHTYTLNEGDGAFYGPKIDIILHDILNRKIQCATIQLDFQLPQRFDLKFKNELGMYETPVIIHRAILGSFERFIAILIESYGKHLPFWLHPRQVGLVTIDCKHENYMYTVEKSMLNVVLDLGIRKYTDPKDTLNKKIRKATLDGCKIICILGDKEMEKNEVNVRIGNKTRTYKIEELLEKIKVSIETKKEFIFN